MTVNVGAPLDPELAAIAVPAAVINTFPVYTAAVPPTVLNKSITTFGQSLVAQTSIANMLTYLTAAPKASPVFTGSLAAMPKSPSPITGTGAEVIATVPYVDSAITNNVSGLYLPITGGTLLGATGLTVDGNGATAFLKVKTVAAGETSQVGFYRGTEARWMLRDRSDEDFEIRAYDVGGAANRVALISTRINGFIFVTNPGASYNPTSDYDATLGRIATCKYVLDQNYAPLASPTLVSPSFTGTVKALDNFWVDRAGDGADSILVINADPNFNSYVSLRSGNNTRWLLMKDATPEGANNAGSYFELRAYDNSATPVNMGAAFEARRDLLIPGSTTTRAPQVTFPYAPIVTATIPANEDSTRVATTAWVRNRTAFVTPEDFPGTDTFMVQSMFNYLAANGGHGLLSRWYTVTAEITCTAVAWFSVTGVGRYISGISKTTIAGDILDIHTAAYITLRSFGLKGAVHPKYYEVDGDANTSSSHGLALHDCDNCLVEDLYVHRWGLGTGIYLNTATIDNKDTSVPPVTISQTIVGTNSRVTGCHVDGYKNAGNGILISPAAYCALSNNFVENICSDKTLATTLQGSPCRALQYKYGVHSTITDNVTRNCFRSLCINGNDYFQPSETSKIIGGIVANPSPNQNTILEGAGIYIGDSISCSAEGVTVEGNNQPNWRGLLISNQSGAGTYVRFKAIDCAGSNGRVAYIDAWQADVEIESMANFGSIPVELGTGAVGCRVRIGQIAGVPSPEYMFNPRHYVTNNGSIVNRIENLYGDVQYNNLSDLEYWSIALTDGLIVMLTVWTNGIGGERFIGWARISSAPAIEASFLGADVAIFTTSLTSGGGTAGKLNIAAIDGHIHIKNMLAGTRDVGVKIETLF